MRARTGPLLKVLAYVSITGLMLALVGLTFTRTRIEAAHTYFAEFSDTSGLRNGLDVRARGVAIGTVQHISLVRNGEAVKVAFTVPDHVRLPVSTVARIRYANLIGDRYLDLSPGNDRNGPVLPRGANIGLRHTKPALDLDAFFAGFDPLMQALQPQQVNELATNLLSVTNGQAGAIDQMLATVGRLTSGLAEHDQLIGEVIDHLAAALRTVDQKSDEVDQLIVGLNNLLRGLSRDRKKIVGDLESVNTLASDTANLVHDIRPGLKENLVNVGTVARSINENSKDISEVFDIYPEVLTKLARAGMYGAWFNFYICQLRLRIEIPGSAPVFTPFTGQKSRRCAFPEGQGNQ
ncbi:MAG: MCE family protein [Aeromicrobium sp.]